MCYDDKNIYFGVMMYDNAPDSILTELSKRDQGNKNYDEFGVWINPFNDGQIEYNFSVTAAGVQKDAKFFPEWSDDTWDAVWKSAVKINDDGLALLNKINMNEFDIYQRYVVGFYAFFKWQNHDAKLWIQYVWFKFRSAVSL